MSLAQAHAHAGGARAYAQQTTDVSTSQSVKIPSRSN